jgi:RNA polymerase sigma factor (sigma-70 family)
MKTDLVADGLKHIRILAHRSASLGFPAGDLESFGNEVLVEALGKFPGGNFLGFLTVVFKRRLIDLKRTCGGLTRAGNARPQMVPLEDVPSSRVNPVEPETDLQRRMKNLSAEQRLILKLHSEGWTMKETAALLKKTEGRISQIFKGAIERLRNMTASPRSREAMRKQWNDPTFRHKMSLALRAKAGSRDHLNRKTERHGKLLSACRKLDWADTGKRARLIAGQHAARERNRLRASMEGTQ